MWVMLLILVMAIAALSACATTHQLTAPTTDSEVLILKGATFSHRAVFKPGNGKHLHVYIEGDGRPWVTPRSMATDPTPRSPLLPQLMAMDAAPALYLGRPCYFATQDSPCQDPRWWTSHRYAQEVVDSLQNALSTYAARYESLVLIGHSGGGTLAYLMAAQRSDVDLLVTLSANLNVELWTAEHGYSPLTGSLNPAQLPPLDTALIQRHYRGAQDDRVSRTMITSVLDGQTNARYIELDAFDHTCCWATMWPQLLNEIAALPQR